jgi:hypothetical protein
MHTYKFSAHDLSDTTELREFSKLFPVKTEFTVSRELQRTADERLLLEVREFMTSKNLGRDPAKSESDFLYALDHVVRKHPVLFRLGRAEFSRNPDVTVVRLED